MIRLSSGQVHSGPTAIWQSRGGKQTGKELPSRSWMKYPWPLEASGSARTDLLRCWMCYGVLCYDLRGLPVFLQDLLDVLCHIISSRSWSGHSSWTQKGDISLSIRVCHSLATIISWEYAYKHDRSFDQWHRFCFFHVKWCFQCRETALRCLQECSEYRQNDSGYKYLYVDKSKKQRCMIAAKSKRISIPELERKKLVWLPRSHVSLE